MLKATSSDGLWSFENGRIYRGTTVVRNIPTIDFFARWTFARFLPGGELALAFESSQPWSEAGSYGDRYGGVQVLARVPDTDEWVVVAFEFDWRRFDETFVPDDIVWHRRGLLAWQRDGELHVQLLARPHIDGAADLIPGRDSDHGLRFSFSTCGAWRSLAVDADGRHLRAIDNDGSDVFDLELCCRARDDGDWEPFEVSTPP